MDGKRETQIACNSHCRKKTDTDGLREEGHKMRLHVCDCKCVQMDRETERVNKEIKIDIKREVQKSMGERERIG